MDFEQNNNMSESMEPRPSEKSSGLNEPATQTKGKGAGWKVFWGIILALSIISNIALLLIVMGLFIVFTARQRDVFAEEILRDGPRRTKIAVIAINGVIDNEQSENFYKNGLENFL